MSIYYNRICVTFLFLIVVLLSNLLSCFVHVEL